MKKALVLTLALSGCAATPSSLGCTDRPLQLLREKTWQDYRVQILEYLDNQSITKEK
jgi:hypothetical protein